MTVLALPRKTVFSSPMGRIRDFQKDPDIALYAPLWMSDALPFASWDKNQHILTRAGALWTPQGYIFDGTDDKISGGNILNPGTSDFTIEAVFKRVAGGSEGREICSKNAGSGTGGLSGYQIQSHYNRWFIQKDDTHWSLITDSTGVLDNLNTWIHAIVDRDDAAISLFVNGVQSTDTQTNGLGGFGAGLDITNTVDFLIGNCSGVGYAAWFPGTIAEVIYYSRLLSAQEKQNHYLESKRRLPWL